MIQRSQRGGALADRIMRRVWLIWAVRLALHPATLKALLGVALFWRSTEYVSYKDVLANAPAWSDVPGNVVFAVNAFANTDGATALIVMGTLLITIWFLKDLFVRPRFAR